MTTDDFDYKGFMTATEPMTDRLLLTVKEAARRLSLSRTMLYELAMRGEIESFKVGRSRRFPTDALMAFIERKRTEQE